MNTVMFWRWLKESRWSAIGYGVGAAIYILLIVSIFPTVRDNSQQLNQLIQIYPEALKKAFGIADISTLAGFLGAEALNIIWPIIVGVFAITAGSAVVAQEIADGTVDLWLSVPERRSRLLLGKVAALIVIAAIIVGISIAAIWTGAVLVNESFALSHLLATFVTMLVLLVTMLAYSVLFSSFMNDRGRAAALAAAVTIGCYLIWIIASMNSTFSWLRYLSIFTVYKPQAALADGTLQVGGVAVLLALSAVCIAAAVVLFARRDAIG